MSEWLRDRIGSRGAVVLVVGVLLALAWAIPSIGASAGKVARTALARANQAFHNANLAQSTSNTAKSTANSANATAGAANATAGAASSTANSAQSTASQALTAASNADEVQDNFSSSLDPPNLTGGTCASDSVSRFGVSAFDEVIVSPPNPTTIGIITQAYTTTGSVTVVFCNVTGGAINLDPGTYEFSTLR